MRRPFGQAWPGWDLARPGAALERLALAAREREGEVLAVVNQALATGDDADDVDGLAEALLGALEGHTMPALDDLRPARAEAKDESVVRH
jgi:hypothetical protein